MNISIIGPGKMGIPLATYLAQVNHRVCLGSRDESKAKRIAKEIGYGVEGKDIQDAVIESDIIFLTVPHTEMEDALERTGPMDGKIVVDVSNCFTPDFSNLTMGYDTSAAEDIAKRIPNAKVVKAFNTIFASILQKGLDFGDQTINVFVASDNARAKQMVSELIESIGLLPVDCGELKSARFIEPMTALILRIDSCLKRDVQIAPSIMERARPA